MELNVRPFALSFVDGGFCFVRGGIVSIGGMESGVEGWWLGVEKHRPMILGFNLLWGGVPFCFIY